MKAKLSIFLPVALAGVCGLPQQIPSQQTPTPLVKRTRLLTSTGGRVDWSKQNRIAFDREGRRGFYDVWVINPDGSGERCLTCDQPEAPRKHKGNPAWDPSGRYIVFEAQKENSLPFVNYLAAPGRGVANDLWIMDAAGRNYWKLVEVKRLPAGGILHPHFSNDGRQLFWSQLVKSSGKLGIWELKVADFEGRDGTPRISNIRTLTPGNVHKFYESHGFDRGDQRILYTAQVETELSDIFFTDLRTGQTENLTNTPNDWDEHAQLSPDGRQIMWASTRGASEKTLNLWIMNRDGSGQRMLMDFHRPGSPVYSEGIGPADSSWSPDGQSLAVYSIADQKETKGSIWILEMN